MAEIYEVGTLGKGDACKVYFPDRRPPWVGRVVALIPNPDQPGYGTFYECMTPHGSTVVAGAAWVSPLSTEDHPVLVDLEKALLQTGKIPYKGRIRIEEK